MSLKTSVLEQDKINKLKQMSLRAVIILLPLVFIPIGYEHFETHKSNFLILYLSLALLLEITSNTKAFLEAFKTVMNKTSYKILLIISLLLVITSFLGLDFTHSLFGSYSRNDGLLIFCLTTLSITLFYTYITNNIINLSEIINCIVKSGIIVSVIGLFKYLLTILTIIPTHDLLYDGREVSTLGQANFYGGFVALILTILPISKYKKSIVVHLILTFAVVISYSKTAYFIIFAYYLILVFNLVGKKLKTQFIVVTAALFLAIVLVLPYIRETEIYRDTFRNNKYYQLNRIDELLNYQNIQNDTRIQIYNLALVSIRKKPLAGYGKGNIDAALFELSKHNESVSKLGILDSSHNMLLDYAIEGGIVCAILLIFFYYFIVNEITNKKLHYAYLLFITSFLFRSFFNINSISILFMVVMLISVIYASKENEDFSL